MEPGGRKWSEFADTSFVGSSISWGYIWLTSQSHFFDEFCVLAFIAGIAAESVFNFIVSSLYVYNEKRL